MASSPCAKTPRTRTSRRKANPRFYRTSFAKAEEVFCIFRQERPSVIRSTIPNIRSWGEYSIFRLTKRIIRMKMGYFYSFCFGSVRMRKKWERYFKKTDDRKTAICFQIVSGEFLHFLYDIAIVIIVLSIDTCHQNRCPNRFSRHGKRTRLFYNPEEGCRALLRQFQRLL